MVVKFRERGWCQGDVYKTTRAREILGTGKTFEELGLEDWEEVVVVGRLRGGGFPAGGNGGVGGISVTSADIRGVQWWELVSSWWVAGGGKGIGPTGRAPVVLAVNPTYCEPGGAAGVDVGAGIGQFGPEVRFNLERASAEKERGSCSGREFSEGVAAPLPVGRLVQEADRPGEATSAVDVLAGLVPGEVVGCLRDVARRGLCNRWCRLQRLFRTGSCRAGLPSLLMRRRRWRRSSRRKGVRLKMLGSTLKWRKRGHGF